MSQPTNLIDYSRTMNLFFDNHSTKHKVFLSFYHKDDESYKNIFETAFGHTFITKSVQEGDIDSDNSDEYIKRLIQQNYISNSSILVVLVGPNTKGRKHVDWEISAALNKKINGYSGLIGILLPKLPLTYERKYYYNDLPARLTDNVKSKYATIYTWSDACSSTQRIKQIIEEAFNVRKEKSNLIKNGRLQKQKNS